MSTMITLFLIDSMASQGPSQAQKQQVSIFASFFERVMLRRVSISLTLPFTADAKGNGGGQCRPDQGRIELRR